MPAEFTEFTYAKVTIKTKGNESGYVISNINTEGEPGSKCGCHLMSIEISSPAYETGNTNSCGTTGKVSLIDYKNAVFNCLLEHMRNFLNDKKEINKEKTKDKAELCPIIDVEMKCYHGNRKWSGYINNWGFQFSGTTPTIEIEFLVLNPNVTNLPVVKDGESVVFDFETAEEYRYATKYLDALNKVYGENMLKLVLIADNHRYEGVEAAKHIAFPQAGIPFKPQKGVGLLYGFMYFAEYGHYSKSGITEIGEDYNSKLDYVGLSNLIDQVSYKTYPPLSAKISDNGKEFILTPSSKRGTGNSDLLFVQNGPWAAYSPVKFDGEKFERNVIPMTSFSFTTDLFKVGIQHRIVNSNSSSNENVNSNNGVIIQQSDGTAKQTSDNKDQAEAALNNTLDTANADPINVTFECYNVLTFEANNLTNQIRIMVFDELGNKISWLDTNLTVRKVTYTLSGGVVKASVEGTTVFNKLSTTGSGGNKSGNVNTGKSYKKKELSQKQKELFEKYPDYMEYITSEDEYPIPLEYDNTCKCSNDEIIKYIKKFFNGKYELLNGKNRNLDYSFVKDLIDNGMYGIIALLYGTCYYGIKKDQVPDYWKTEKEYRWGNDPHNGVPGKELPKEGQPGGQAAWRASDTGKNPYDYEGGLGLPDFDGGGQLKLYTYFGFPAKFEEYKEGLKQDAAIRRAKNGDLKAQVDGKDVSNLKELEKAYEHILIKAGSIKWSNSTYKDHITGKKINRRKPEFVDIPVDENGNRVEYQNAINPLPDYPTAAKHYDYWRAYGYLVTRNLSMQFDMALRWIENNWNTIIKKLKNKDAAAEKAKTGHTICLQDAIRLSKIYNSNQGQAENAIYNNLTVKYQYTVYTSTKTERALSHFAYCQRACRFVEWELIHDGKLKVEDKNTDNKNIAQDNNSQDNNQQ